MPVLSNCRAIQARMAKGQCLHMVDQFEDQFVHGLVQQVLLVTNVICCQFLCMGVEGKTQQNNRVDHVTCIVGVLITSNIESIRLEQTWLQQPCNQSQLQELQRTS